MHKKALSAAIATALAAPLAAQAVEFTVSGHVNRALVITDTDASIKGKVKVQDNGSSGTRVRFKGSSEIMDGRSVGVNLEYGAGSELSLRYGEVWYGGEFGTVTIGQGDQGGEGSVYSDKSGVFGVGHGQEKGASELKDYFGSLDGGGGRTERIRYDTPSVGPFKAAVSVGNDDQVSAGLFLSQDLGGTSFGAKVGTIQKKKGEDTISASAGAKLPSGLTLSGAWGQGDNMGAATTDPSFFQAMVGYVFGNTSVAASWYSSEDFVTKGSEGTAMGVAVKHTLPKVGADIYAAVQNYDVKKTKGATSTDETVLVVGTRIKF